jgi:hypothetical protein
MECLNFGELPKRWYVLQLVYGRSAMMMMMMMIALLD